jgi:hypothetical protein
LIKDNSGISIIIGAMLLFVILISTYTTIQVTLVPIWNAALEYEHFDVLKSDFIKLKSNVEDVSIHKISKSSDIHLGFRYPNRMIFFNPEIGKFGNLNIEPINITIEYKIGNTSFSKNFNSSRITYESLGIAQIPKLVYEHGVIIQDFGNKSIELNQQSLISMDDIYIPLITAPQMSLSSMDVISLNLEPYWSTQRKIKYINITMDTNYPEVWRALLSNVNTSYTTAYVTNNKIIINSSAAKYILLPMEITPETETIYAFIICSSTKAIPPEFPPITNIDPTKPNYPTISNITANIYVKKKVRYATITATVTNATAPYDIHANLVDLTNNPLDFDVNPDASSPNNINADAWPLPNSNIVQWTDIPIEKSLGYEYAIITLWALNSNNNMQFVTTTTIKLE